jgi:hypothetical protein
MKPKTKLFLPHRYSSLRAVLARGLYSENGERKNERRRMNKSFKSGFFITIILFGLA